MKKIIRFLAVIFLFVVLALGGCIYFAAPRPPKEAKLIQNFNEHRADFEQLRDMLQADTNLTRVANWGIETRKPFFLGYPPGGNFSVDRFNKYLALFKETGALAAARGEGKNADASIFVWAWGFAGDTRHIGICWLDEQPTNQIPTLDGYRGQSVYPNTVVAFKHIDQQWYLRADW
ncbi:MAG TPA: hypothetical protein VK769_06830 [Verrucomicrobiae bacterium]|nr:hypothetical protein [Verrucomicrobiae bacterium]